MRTKEVNNSPTTIIAFDPNYKLVAIFKSISEAASLTKTLRQSLIKAAYGEIISVGKRYWRVVPEDFVIEQDDIGVLDLFDFDAEIGEDRKIYPTRHMIKSSAMFESEYILLKSKKE